MDHEKEEVDVTIDTYNVIDRKMGRPTGMAIAGTVIAIGAALLGLPGAIFTTQPELGFAIGAAAWLAIYLICGGRVNPKQRFTVIERLGQVYMVKLDGDGFYVLCLPGLIDKIKQSDTLSYKALQIYGKDPESIIHFTDGSAPISASVHFCIGAPKPPVYKNENGQAVRTATQKEWIEQIKRDILRWTYAFSNPEDRIRALFRSLLRPKLQGLSIDEGLKTAKKFFGQAENDRKIHGGNFKDIGTYLHPKTAFTFEGVQIPEEIKRERRKRIEGEADAARIVSRSAGAIKKLHEELKGKFGEAVTFEDAERVWQTLLGFETVRDTGSNVTFLAPDTSRVLATIGVDGRVRTHPDEQRKDKEKQT